MGIQFSASANGTRNTGPVNMGGGANLIERSLFSSNTPTLAYSSWYNPGNGSPAISTSDYYLMNGFYKSRPYDLDTMGAEGAAVKAREGMRYVWMMCADHIGDFPGGWDLFVGYSNDPQVLPDPATLRTLYGYFSYINVVDQNGYTQNTFFPYQVPFLVYNADGPSAAALAAGVPAGDKFYIYMEGLSTSSGRQHELTLLTSADFSTTATLVGPTIPTTSNNGWSSYGQPRRLGVNDWVVYALGELDGVSSFPIPSSFKYTSTDGWVWTPDYSKTAAYVNPVVTISGQDWMILKEAGTTNDYLSMISVDADRVYTGTTTRISTGFGPSDFVNTTADHAYPGPTYFQDVEVYEEDGVATIYLSRGFPVGNHDFTNVGPFLNNFPNAYTINGDITANVLTVNSVPANMPPLAVGFRIKEATNKSAIISFGTGSGGVGTYNMGSSPANIATGNLTVITNGGLWQQFVDLYYLTTDATAAASAAPLGVRASCAAGVVTIQWNNSLPHQNYRVYRGTTVGTQATLIGDVAGTSITDTPTAGSQYFYKVVTMNGGEQKSRVVNVYASNNTVMVNKHVNRAINDGCDPSTIDMTWLASVDSYLTTNDYYKYLMYWVDARFGYKLDGSGFISKIYCLGTTRLPVWGDFTPTTSNTFPSTSSNTSYSATSFRGTTPSWINNASSARGYFGNGRANNIQRKNEITVIAAYQRPSGTGTATLLGTGQFNRGWYLQQSSGASGNINFAMAAVAGASLITATVPFASATAAHVAAGVFDGTNMTAYLDGVAGTPVDASSINNPTMVNDTALRGQVPSSIPTTSPIIISGARTGLQTLLTKAYNNSDAHGLFTGAGLMAFEKGSSQIVADVTALYA